MADEGMKEIDKALQLKPDYIEGLVYKGLLLRLQAGLTPDKAVYDRLLREAQGYSDRANALQKKKAQGVK
jgi:hypothetical protein